MAGRSGSAAADDQRPRSRELGLMMNPPVKRRVFSWAGTAICSNLQLMKISVIDGRTAITRYLFYVGFAFLLGTRKTYKV